MNKNNELKLYTNEQEKQFNGLQENQAEIEQRIDRKNTSVISIAQYKLDTDKSLYDHMQAYIDDNFDREKYKGKNQINSGLVVYEDRYHRTEVIFEGNFEVIGNYNYNAKTEKIKDALEEFLVTQYLEIQNPTLIVSLKKLASEISDRPSDLRKNIVYIMESLQTIRISYKTKGKLKNVFTDFASMRIISSSEYHKDTDLLEVNFDNKYAYNLTTHNFFQLPKKYRKINDNSFQYAYPMAKYIFELCYHNNYRITFKSLYERIKKIPRIENIRKKRGSPRALIYDKVHKHFNELNKIGDFTIAFENEDFLIQNKGNKELDFDKMLETYITIKWYNKPKNNNTDKTKEKKQQKIINDRQRQITKATIKELT